MCCLTQQKVVLLTFWIAATLKIQHFYPSAIKEDDKCKLNSCQPCAPQANQPLEDSVKDLSTKGLTRTNGSTKLPISVSSS